MSRDPRPLNQIETKSRNTSRVVEPNSSHNISLVCRQSSTQHQLIMQMMTRGTKKVVRQEVAVAVSAVMIEEAGEAEATGAAREEASTTKREQPSKRPAECDLLY